MPKLNINHLDMDERGGTEPIRKGKKRKFDDTFDDEFNNISKDKKNKRIPRE